MSRAFQNAENCFLLDISAVISLLLVNASLLDGDSTSNL